MRFRSHAGTSAMVLAIIAASIVPGRVLSQDGSATSPEERRGAFLVGYLQLDLGDVNRELEAAGYPALREGFLTLGGGGYTTRDRFVAGGEANGVLGASRNTVNGAYTVSATGGFGVFRLGYIVHRTAHLDVFPLVGIGGGTMSLKIAQRNDVAFGDVLADPRRSATLSSVTFVMDASLHVNVRIPVRQREPNREGGIVLGLQGGYSVAPWASGWTLDGLNSVDGGPSIRLRGPFVRISVGGWNVDRGHER
jgi:hypothetical protein